MVGVVKTVKEALFLVWVLSVYAGRLWTYCGLVYSDLNGCNQIHILCGQEYYTDCDPPQFSGVHVLQ